LIRSLFSSQRGVLLLSVWQRFFFFDVFSLRTFVFREPGQKGHLEPVCFPCFFSSHPPRFTCSLCHPFCSVSQGSFTPNLLNFSRFFPLPRKCTDLGSSLCPCFIISCFTGLFLCVQHPRSLLVPLFACVDQGATLRFAWFLCFTLM